ncbi:selenocysteine-specific translation elongation factor [uncultured Sulfitobacter sp.]|uniref:selenocysteine-specific translation elongation factor n=1 Tax=uncultured Sulfitobacter sp. TaxID=191468 RepID=UPI002602FB92|nr:selenocysteine-specific translation elongation factor [uncultured Sulfitobacter sp.]
MKSRCIVVIGHVDHGKTSLVRALTGTQTDTAPEEIARGLTIRPGFAHKHYSTGTVDFIDAPGHEDFVQAMVCGAAGAQAALLVVDATEGIRPQTLEHLQIAGHLGISQGVVAVTKSDLPSDAELAETVQNLRRIIAGTALAGAAIIPCSALGGAGIEHLHDAVQSLLQHDTVMPTPSFATLPVDRAFTLKGRGTVVTGTLIGGPLTTSAALVIQPSGQPVTLRALHSRGEERQHVFAGTRVAANLRATAVADIPRGAVLTSADAPAAGRCIDVDLKDLTDTPKHMQQVRLLFGTTACIATVRRYAGAAQFAQLRLTEPAFAYEGQPAVIRSLSPPKTLGGVIFLDCQAHPTRAGDKSRLALLQTLHDGSPANIATALCTQNGGAAQIADVARLARISSSDTHIALQSDFTKITDCLIAPTDHVIQCEADLLAKISAYHATFPLRPAMPIDACAPPKTDPALFAYAKAQLRADGTLREIAGGIALAAHDPFTKLSDAQRLRLTALAQECASAGLTPLETPATPSEAALVDLLVHAGHIIWLNNIALGQMLAFHWSALAAAAATLNDVFELNSSFTTSQARKALATSRKIIVPVLEHFDATGVTRRTDALRQMTGELPVPPTPLPC